MERQRMDLIKLPPWKTNTSGNVITIAFCTPLGVHLESPNCSKLHAHIAPGHREFVPWDRFLQTYTPEDPNFLRRMVFINKDNRDLTRLIKVEHGMYLLEIVEGTSRGLRYTTSTNTFSRRYSFYGVEPE
jgi:hypothetical protein